jgi:hypothetical protein
VIVAAPEPDPDPLPAPDDAALLDAYSRAVVGVVCGHHTRVGGVS